MRSRWEQGSGRALHFQPEHQPCGDSVSLPGTYRPGNEGLNCCGTAGSRAVACGMTARLQQWGVVFIRIPSAKHSKKQAVITLLRNYLYFILLYQGKCYKNGVALYLYPEG